MSRNRIVHCSLRSIMISGAKKPRKHNFSRERILTRERARLLRRIVSDVSTSDQTLRRSCLSKTLRQLSYHKALPESGQEQQKNVSYCVIVLDWQSSVITTAQNHCPDYVNATTMHRNKRRESIAHPIKRVIIIALCRRDLSKTSRSSRRDAVT